MATDRFGNPHAPNLPYARGRILATTEDDFRKLQRAWAIIRERGPDAVFVFTGLEHSLPMTGEEVRFADDELAPRSISSGCRCWRWRISAGLPTGTMSRCSTA